MTEVRVLSASGQLGSGFLESSFERGVSLAPHVIACDAGSTDGGPAYLGSGKPHFSREGTKRDLRLMLRGRDRLNVPMHCRGDCARGGVELSDGARPKRAGKGVHQAALP
jgi:hypothetical protein